MKLRIRIINTQFTCAACDSREQHACEGSAWVSSLNECLYVLRDPEGGGDAMCTHPERARAQYEGDGKEGAA